MIDRRRVSEAAIRNREPILQVLQRHVAAGDHVLELAAGSGQHAVFLAPRLPVAAWQPTDPDAEARASIDAWRAAEPCPVIQPALALDVEAPEWPVARADVLLAINLVHISPWSTTVALFDGAARLGPRIAGIANPPLASAAPANSPLILQQAAVSQWVLGASGSLIFVKLQNRMLRGEARRPTRNRRIVRNP